jgi:hypothetical protein
MTSMKSLAARFYRLKSGHAPTGAYLKRFEHREDDMLVVQRRSSTDTGAPLRPLHPMERPAESALEGGGKGHRMETVQMPTCADF